MTNRKDGGADHPFISAPQTQPSYLVPMDKRDQPRILAELFCDLCSSDQAEFFDRVAEIDKGHWERKGIFQWRSMQQDLSERARQVIVDMYDHTSEEFEREKAGSDE